MKNKLPYKTMCIAILFIFFLFIHIPQVAKTEKVGRIVVEEAITVQNYGLTYDSTISSDLIGSVIPRLVVDFSQSQSLYVLKFSNELLNIVEISPRIIVDFPQSMFSNAREEKLILSANYMYFDPGDPPQKINVFFNGNHNETIMMSSLDSFVASVNSDGLVTPGQIGKTIIYVSTADKKYVNSCLVAVGIDESLKFGDVNGTGDITVADAIVVLRHIVGLNLLDDDALKRAKVSDVEGPVSVQDAILILRYVVGLITKFPVETK